MQLKKINRKVVLKYSLQFTGKSEPETKSHSKKESLKALLSRRVKNIDYHSCMLNIKSLNAIE
jgi:hypothetical protein